MASESKKTKVQLITELKNTRLELENNVAQKQLLILSSVQNALADEFDMQKIYDIVGDKIQEIFNAQAIVINTFNKEKNVGYSNYLYEKGKRFYKKPNQIPSWKRLSQTFNKTIVINRNFEEEGKKFGLRNVAGEVSKSGVWVPLKSGGQLTGTISIQNVDQENAFSDSDVQLLETLAVNLSVALENAKLFNETNQRNSELSVINTVQEALTSNLDIDEIYESVGEELQKIFDAQTITFYDIDLKTKTVFDPFTFEKGKRLHGKPRPYSSIFEAAINNKNSSVYVKNVEEYVKQFEDYKHNVGELPKSMVSVKIIEQSDRVILLSLQDLENYNGFDESTIKLLETIGGSMGAALENAILFSETSQRNAELAVINAVQEGLASEMDINSIYEVIGDQLNKIFKSQVITIYDYDLKTNMVHYPYIFEKGKRLFTNPRPIQLIGKARIESGETTFIIKNVPEYISNQFPDHKIPSGEMPKSSVHIKSLNEEDRVVTLSLQDIDNFDAFKNSDIQLLETLAGSLSIALKNAQLFEETSQRNSELAVINSIQNALAAELDINGVYEVVGEQLKNIFSVQTTGIYVGDFGKNLQTYPYIFEKGKRFHIEPRQLNEFNKFVYKLEKTYLLNANFHEVSSKYANFSIPAGEEPKSILVVPVLRRGSLFVTISLQDMDNENFFTDEHVQLLETIASSMKVALQNAYLFEETNQRNAELAVINSVQEGLASELNINGIFAVVGEELRKIFNSQIISIYDYDLKSGMVHFPYTFEKGERFFSEPIPMREIEKITVASEDTTFYIKNLPKYLKSLPVKHENTSGKLPKSILSVKSLVERDRVVLLSLQDIDSYDAFKDTDIQLLETLASSLRVALENAQLFDETNQRNAELAITNSVSELISKSLDVDEVIKIVGDKVQEIFKADMVLIALLNEDKVSATAPYSFADGKYFEEGIFTSDSRSLGWKVSETKKPILANTSDEMNSIGTVSTNADDAREQSIQSWLGVPIIVNDESIGMVAIQDYRSHAYDEKDMQLLSTLSTNMGIAIENARLFNETTRLLAETNQRAAELAITNSVSESISKSLDVDEVVKIVGDKVNEIFSADVVSIGLIEDDNNIRLAYSLELGKYANYLIPIPKGKGLVSKVIESKKPLRLNTNEEQSALGGIILGETGNIQETSDDNSPTESWIGVPIMVGEKLIGIVFVQSLKQFAFKDSDVQLLSTLSTNMGVAIENARLFNETTRLLAETNQRAAELAITNSVSESISKSLDVDEVVKIVGDKVSEIFKGNNVAIGLIDNDENVNMLFYLEKGKYITFSNPIPKGIGLVGKLIQSRKSILLHTAEDIYKFGGIHFSEDGNWENKEEYKDSESWAGVPIIVSDKIIGAVFIQSYQQFAFKNSDVQLLSTLSTNMGVAIENARLFNETTRLLAETDQRAAELAITNSVSESISKSLDVDEVINIVGEQISKLLGQKNSTNIILLNDQDLLEVRYSSKIEHKDIIGYSFQKDTGLTGKVISEKKPLLYHTFSDQKKNGSFAPKDYDPEIHGPNDESWMGVPIIVGDKITGAVIIRGEQKASFSTNDLQLLSTLSTNMGVAIENARLFNETTRLLAETDQRAAELAITNSVSESISKSLDVDEVIKIVGDKIKEIFESTSVSIGLIDKNEDIQMVYGFDKGNYQPNYPPIPKGKGLVNHLIQKKKPLVLNSLEEKISMGAVNVNKKGEITTSSKENFLNQSWMGVPIVVGKILIGVVFLQNIEKFAYQESDVQLLSTLSTNMGVAIENARLFNETAQRNAELAVINSVQDSLAAELDINGIYEAVGDEIRKIFETQVTAIHVVDLEKNTMTVPYTFEKGKRFKRLTTPLTDLHLEILKNKKSNLFNRNFKQFAAKFNVTEVAQGEFPESFLMVPIILIIIWWNFILNHTIYHFLKKPF
jgi:GAF domain-containing protein